MLLVVNICTVVTVKKKYVVFVIAEHLNALIVRTSVLMLVFISVGFGRTRDVQATCNGTWMSRQFPVILSWEL